MKNRIVAFAIVAALAVAGGALIVHRERATGALPPPAAAPVPVRVDAVREGAVAEAVRTVALVQAETATTVAAQAAGALVEVRRREGDRVERGDLLARIDARTLDDAVESARARQAAAAEELRRQEAVFARDERLFAGQAISRQALDASRAQLEAARAGQVAAQRALDTARTARAYADVVAPYRGVVTARLVEPGDLAAPGKPLFTIHAPGPVKLISKLSQTSLASVAAGGPVSFTEGAREVRGKVARVFPALDASRLGSVETVLPEAPFGLSPGAIVAASYEARPVAGLVVPTLSLLDGIEETLVIRVRDGRAEPVPVAVLARGAREAAVRGALAAGDLVVTGLPSELMALTAGTSLRAAPRAAAAVAAQGEGRP